MTKTNVGLVQYAHAKLGTAYVYGAKMEILTKARFDFLKKTYGSLVWESDASKIGMMCCDCSGLISGYTGKFRNSSEHRNVAKEVFPISTVATAPLGALVWHQGHVGIYVGLENGIPHYIAADGSAYGCRKRPLPAKYTHWFCCPDVEYVGETAKTPAASAGEQENPAGIAVGGVVTIKPGAVYGGLASARGRAVPASVIGRRLTIGKMATHHGALEALLTEIVSWVGVKWLTEAR